MQSSCYLILNSNSHVNLLLEEFNLSFYRTKLLLMYFNIINAYSAIRSNPLFKILLSSEQEERYSEQEIR
ncbi:hypothetical protein EUGRSUZ_G00354 [Eucalyptus grandis]|uniref:Uncharacterized protein n=2 Tax=Eucalyptus grandis TaxID=71139 RepID=A0ACC3K167_EUCGR|nr:hypothetical protein EUGRSUZ_G00354 [Eucalyptus grandis]